MSAADSHDYIDPASFRSIDKPADPPSAASAAP